MCGGTGRRRKNLGQHETHPRRLGFRMWCGFSHCFPPPFLANLCICLSFPPSVKVSTQCIAVVCLWKHSLNASVRESLSRGMMMRESRKKMAIVKLTHRILNIYWLRQHLFFLFLSSSSSNQTPTPSHQPTIFSSVSMALIGYSETGAVGRVIDLRPSCKVAVGLHRCFRSSAEETESQHPQTSGGLLCQVEWLTKSSITVPFLLLLLPGWRGTQLSASVCVSPCVFVSDFPLVCASVRMHLCLSVSC